MAIIEASKIPAIQANEVLGACRIGGRKMLIFKYGVGFALWCRGDDEAEFIGQQRAEMLLAKKKLPAKPTAKRPNRRAPRAVAILQSYLENRLHCAKEQKEMAKDLGLTPSDVSKALNHPTYGPGLRDQIQAATSRPESWDTLDIPREFRS